MGFNPIHNFLPRKNKRDKDHTATFVTPNFRIGHPNYYLPQVKDVETYPKPSPQFLSPFSTPVSSIFNLPKPTISQVSTLINVPEKNIVQK